MMKRRVFFLAALFSGFLLFAQETPPATAEASSGDVTSDYRLGEDGKIRQRIAWTRANAYFYEIEIEKIGPGAVWALELKERTEQIFLEVSLPPGMYRYRILNYNVLGRVGAVSEWTGIRVFVAKQPAAESYSPAAYFVDSRAGKFTLTITGRDLVEDAQVYMAFKKEEAEPVFPSSITYSAGENTITADFPAEGLDLGAYDIVIINPGGLRQTIEGFSVSFSRPLDINVSLGYAPVLPLSGYLFDTYDSALYPLGFYGRAGLVPFKQLWGWIGFELSLCYTGLKTENRAYQLSGRMISADAGVLFQKWMRNYSLALNLRLGGGINFLSDIEFTNEDGSRSEKESATLINLNAGASIQWLVWNNLFIEAGVDFFQALSSQSPNPGFFRAALALGRRF
jgi:hypothetical protein